MKTFLGIFALVFGLSLKASATEILLNCNTSGGPDQQVTVLNQNNQLLLRELASNGMTYQRALSIDEWQSKTLQLRSRATGERNSLTKVSGGWWYEAVSPGWRENGYADCF